MDCRSSMVANPSKGYHVEVMFLTSWSMILSRSDKGVGPYEAAIHGHNNKFKQQVLLSLVHLILMLPAPLNQEEQRLEILMN